MSNNEIAIPKLIALTQGLNNDLRKEATAKLDSLESEHFANFILELCRILASASESTSIRQGAGLLLRKCIGGGRSEEFRNRTRERWASQQEQIRHRIKHAIVDVLGVPDEQVRNTAVNVISNLALIETLQEWTDLLPTLISKCLSKNNELMYSALKCIGQIAEDDSAHMELQKYSPKILECIAHGMSVSNGRNAASVQSESMKCLHHIIELIRPNMQVERERTIIFQMVCCGASNGPNKDLRLNSFMCISRLIEFYYSLLAPYMQSIFGITKTTVEKGINQNEDPDVTKQAIEVWSTCAEVEYDIMCENEMMQQQKDSQAPPVPARKNFGFVNKALQLMVPIYLKALLLQSEDEDEDEWTIRKAAACSLELFAAVARDNILNYVLKFVEQHVSSADWKQREAALGAFGYVLDGPAPDKLVGLTTQILDIVLKLMGDSNQQVRATAVWVFGRICDLLPDAVGSRNILQPLVKALQDRNSICNKACWSIASLTKYYSDKQVNNACIYADQNAFKLIQELMSRCNRTDNTGTVIVSIHEAINNIIYFLPEGTQQTVQALQSLLVSLIKQMQDCCGVITKNNSNNMPEQVMYKMAGLFSTIQITIDKLGIGCLNEEMTGNIMTCCCSLLQKDNDLVYEEALGCITYVARCVGAHFQKFLQAPQVQELLIKAIRLSTRNESICRIGAGVIGDVYTSCAEFISSNPQSLQPYTDRIVAELLTILINTEIHIHLKGHIVDSLTDILIAHGTYAYRYSNDILDKCLDIGCLIPPDDADADLVDTFNEIRVSIIDTCRSCMAELAQAQQINDFQKYLPKIHNFFNAMAKDLKRISVEVLKSCIKLLSEAADYCDPGTKQKLQTSAVSQILQKAGSLSKQQPELAQQAQKAFTQIANTAN